MKEQNFAWPAIIKIDGEIKTMRNVIATCKVELFYCGNRKDGWAVYIGDTDDSDKHQQVSPIFSYEQGDRLSDLLAACERAYEYTPVKGLSFLPDDQWNWETT